MTKDTGFFGLLHGCWRWVLACGTLRKSTNCGRGDSEVYTQKLSQSTTGYDFWTTPPSEKVFKDSPVSQRHGRRGEGLYRPERVRAFSNRGQAVSQLGAWWLVSVVSAAVSHPRSTRSNTSI